MKKKTLVKFVIYMIFGLVMAVLNFESQGVFTEVTLGEKMGALSDCFLFPAVLFGGIGLLAWIAAQGTFDMLAFGFSHFIGGIVNPKKRQESFYEYKMRKCENASEWPKEMLLVGAIYMVLCLGFLVPYMLML